ncbi:MAG: alpha-L-fucosidase [Bacteroidetes bacterium]|nr:alpha-L-fucosidase [Bacteroidota bacterium]
MKTLIITTCIVFFFLISFAQTSDLKNPVPSDRQLEWNKMEYYFFVHFGPNTFTDLEWGKGTEHEEVFDPSQLDCRQWCRIAKAAGAEGIIITAKHHDGFCLWPSKYSTHTVRESKWRNGKGDVLKELSEACKEYGLKFGVYLSPWDRNHPKYGTPEYNDVFVNMMKEIVTNYGPLFEFWWDGANGEGPNGKKQIYDWHRFEKTMRDLSPQTVVFSDIGPDIRWVGNENGIAGDPNWNLLDTAGFKRGEGAPPNDTLNHGNAYGKNWIPAECDVSIRPGWFYHQQEDGKVKTPETLFDLYLKSIGRGAHLILNVPPDRRGLINEHDSINLIGFKKLRDQSFNTNLSIKAKPYFLGQDGRRLAPALNDNNTNTFESIELTKFEPAEIIFEKDQPVNCIILKENLIKGQYCARFHMMLRNEKGELVKRIDGTTIGRKKIITFPAINISKIGIVIDDQKANTSMAEIEAYHIDDQLVEHLP